MSNYYLKTTCVGCGIDFIEAIIENSREITFETIRKALGASLLNEYFPQSHPRLKDDGCVTYQSSVVDGVRYYIVRHSGIEHIFASA